MNTHFGLQVSSTSAHSFRNLRTPRPTLLNSEFLQAHSQTVRQLRPTIDVALLGYMRVAQRKAIVAQHASPISLPLRLTVLRSVPGFAGLP
ncbi:unnamed protein product [Closterium sp. Yama58-4]|nr:unnamed protein product [Closterium sp. Yama58-4]